MKHMHTLCNNTPFKTTLVSHDHQVTILDIKIDTLPFLCNEFMFNYIFFFSFFYRFLYLLKVMATPANSQ